MRDLLLMAVLMGCVPLAIFNPQFGILAYVWVGLMNPHRFVYRLSTFPVALTLGAATALGMAITRKMGRFPIRSETVLIILWFLYTTFTSMVALSPNPWDEWNRFARILLMAVIAGMLLQDRKRLNQFVFVIMASIAFFGVKGGIFSIITRGNYLVWGPDDTFIAGNNELALAELMILPLILYFIRQETRGWRRIALQGAFALSTISIICSYSRGALVGFAGLTLALVWRSRHRFRALAMATFAVGLILTFSPKGWMNRMSTIEQYQQDPSALGRINAWHFAWNLATNRFIGGGFRSFTPELFLRFAPEPLNYHDAHSIYFEVLGEQGFPGLAIFLSLMGASLLRLQRLRNETKGRPEWKWVRDLAEMLQGSIIAYALAGAFLGLAYFDLYYYIIIAGVLLDVVYRGEKRKRAAAPEPAPEAAWHGTPAPRPA